MRAVPPLERDLTPAAKRARVCRHRKRERIVVGRQPEIPEHVRVAMVERGWIAESDALDLNALVDVLEEIMDCWARRTLTCEPISRA